MKNSTYKLFVYGSLRSGFMSPAYDYISHYFSLVGEGKVKGYLFDMGSYPAARPTDNDAFIIGELYQLNNENEFSWAFGQLDDYEGVAPGEDEEPLYKREVTTVHINGKTEQAWIYWYIGDVTGHPVVASGDVLQFKQQKSKI
jgi:gamma-glutamylcyclotransferase (GGCT)/AIG2-like uncharacterized protein YtfP